MHQHCLMTTLFSINQNTNAPNHADILLNIILFCQKVKMNFVQTKAAHFRGGYNCGLHRCVTLRPHFFYQLGYKFSKYSEFLPTYQPWPADPTRSDMDVSQKSNLFVEGCSSSLAAIKGHPCICEWFRPHIIIQ